MILRSVVTYCPEKVPSLEPLIKKAVAEAIARQKALGLKNYYVNEKGHIYARLPNGRYASVKDPVEGK